MGAGSDRQSKGNEMTDDEIWNLGRECRLMTTQPGTQGFDEAVFTFARRLINLEKAENEILEAERRNETT